MPVEVRIEKDVTEIAKLRDITTTKVNQFAAAVSDELVTEVKDQIYHTDTIASGRLFRSITSQVIGQFSTNIQVAVGSSLPYAEFAEEGRNPGKQPPVDLIMQWMVDKGVDSPYGLESGAYLIARSIGEKGTSGKHFFQRGVENVLDRLPTIAEGIFRDVKKQGILSRIFRRLFG